MMLEGISKYNAFDSFKGVNAYVSKCLCTSPVTPLKTLLICVIDPPIKY